MIVLKPDTSEKIYHIAAKEFVAYYRKTTGIKLSICEDDGKSDLVIIGSNGINRLLADWIVEKEVAPLRFQFGSDEYQIKTCKVGNRRVLILAGGLGRSTLYAVYDYFERAFGCRYFWDGERIPKSKDGYQEFDVLEKPRFEYRGTRYFAHRGCKRFQAEMWGFEDWKREIDYLLKRRMNLFMLRTGQDDLFQKAFPNLVDYPTAENMSELDYGGVYIDRRLFWPLEYKGKLRKRVLSYAFDRGLIHPEDFGTMTHWYSPTPKRFIEEKKPKFFNEAGGGDTANFSVWDMREREWFEHYLHLTKTHIKHYGKAEMFHTIGFAERLYSDDPDKNMLMKKYMLDKFTQYIAEHYPNAPILIAAWDIWMRYTPDEVKRLVDTLDPKRYLIFDYTSDGVRSNNFTQWNLVGKFPYVFGLFHAYESTNDMLGFYALSEERMAVAKADEYCKGMIIWPELVHSDTLMQEFFAVNAWSDRVIPISEVLEKLCKDRYASHSEEMLSAWQDALKVIELMHWSMSDNAFCFKQYNYLAPEAFIDEIINGVRPRAIYPQMDIDRAREALCNGVSCLEKLSKLTAAANKDKFIRRDILDIFRTVIGKFTHAAYAVWGEETKACLTGEGTRERFEACANACKTLLCSLRDGLSLADEYCLAATLTDLNKTHKVYDGFELTLKRNILNRYCRSGVYELVREAFIPECEALKTALIKGLDGGKIDSEIEQGFLAAQREIEEKFFLTPLAQMNEGKTLSLEEVLQTGITALKNLCL